MSEPVGDVADHLLDALERKTSKFFCFFVSKIVQERLKKCGASDVHIAVVKSGYTVGDFQPLLLIVTKDRRYIRHDC